MLKMSFVLPVLSFTYLFLFAPVAQAFSVPVHTCTRQGRGNRTFVTCLNNRGLPVYKGVQASFYSYEDPTVTSRYTSTVVRFNTQRPMIAVSFVALFDLGIYRLAYGDVLRITHPRNGRQVEVVVADVGTLHAHVNTNRVLDLTRPIFRALGYPNPDAVGVINGLNFEVIYRIGPPPTRNNKLPGVANYPSAVNNQIARVERGDFRGGHIPPVIARPVEHIVTRTQQFVTQPVNSLFQQQPVTPTERELWQKLALQASDFNQQIQTREYPLLVSPSTLNSLQAQLSYHNILYVAYQYQKFNYYHSLWENNQLLEQKRNRLTALNTAHSIASLIALVGIQ